MVLQKNSEKVRLNSLGFLDKFDKFSENNIITLKFSTKYYTQIFFQRKDEMIELLSNFLRILNKKYRFLTPYLFCRGSPTKWSGFERLLRKNYIFEKAVNCFILKKGQNKYENQSDLKFLFKKQSKPSSKD